jgi:hypothetical protein
MHIENSDVKDYSDLVAEDQEVLAKAGLFDAVDKTQLPIALPELYGDNAWLFPLAKQGDQRKPTKLGVDGPINRQDVAVMFTLTPGFRQTDKQKAFTDHIRLLAESQGISALRQISQDIEALDVKKLPYVIPTLVVGIVVYYALKNDDTIDLITTPVVSFDVPETNYDFGIESQESGEYTKQLAELFVALEQGLHTRTNTLTKRLLRSLDSYSNTMSHISQIQATSSLDDEDDAAPIGSNELLKQQQAAAMAELATTFDNAARTGKNFQKATLEIQGIESFAEIVNEISGAIPHVNTFVLVRHIVEMIGALTTFATAVPEEEAV